MSKGRFRFSTEIFRHLGEELNPNIDQGLIELVKNAYDADAHTCEITFMNVDEAGGWIQIKDDGDGMSLDQVRDGWLVLGESGKRTTQRTRLGRIPAGSKGLGRLAALRLGSEASLTTRPRDHKSTQYSLHLDWDLYKDVRLVESIELDIVRERRVKNTGPGTDIIIANLRDKIDRWSAKRLTQAMILLADPFDDDSQGFRPRLVSQEFDDLSELIRRRYFDDATFRLVAGIGAKGQANARVLDWRGEELFSAEHEDIAKGRDGKAYRCMRAELDLWVFILTKENFRASVASVGEVRKWLEHTGGVHIYYNGLRVAPYGEEGNDWLDMNLSRVRNPEERPGTNTSIGRFRIIDRDEILLQKTDRSGFIENTAFNEIRQFGKDSLDWMASRRMRVAEERRIKQRREVNRSVDKSKKVVDKALEEVRDPEQKKEIISAFEIHERAREKEVDSLRREVQLYRTLATVGITSATFSHESSSSPIKSLTLNTGTIRRRAMRLMAKGDFEKLQKPIDKIDMAIESIGALSGATMRLLGHEKRRPRRVNLHEVIKGSLENFAPFLNGRDVEVTTNLIDANPFVQGSHAAVESIITNLVNNSLAAFEYSGSMRRHIRIETDIEGDQWLMRFLDSGPGIRDIRVKDIWLPGRTTRPNGTGLGLTIVRDAVTDLGGDVRAIPQGEIGGAEIHIQLTILGA